MISRVSIAAFACGCVVLTTAGVAGAAPIRALGGMQPMPAQSPNGPAAPPAGPSVAVNPSASTSATLTTEGDHATTATGVASDPGRSTVSIGAHVGVWNELSPAEVFGGLVFLETARDSGRTTDGALRVSVSRTLGKTVDFGAGSGKFTWTKGTFDLCPLVFRLTADFALRPCATLSGGVVQAQGVDGPSPRSSTRPWVGAGALARASWDLGGPLRLEAQAGANFTLWRDTFGFGAVDVYSADSWVPFGSVGVALSL